MTPRIRASINPDVLRWAREDAGLTLEDAARKAGVTSTERVEGWEDGIQKPTLRQLRLLASAYRRPTAFFYRSDLPEETKDLTDFRRLPTAIRIGGMSPELRYEIRRARARRDVAIDVAALLGEEPPKIEIGAERREGVQPIAKKLRSLLGVNLKNQHSWRHEYAALKGWTRAAEDRGFLVFQMSGVEVAEARGFSITDRPFPVVALNGKDSPRGRIFTFAHELCHVALNRGGLCDLHESSDWGWVEPFCNSVAAEMLVPQKDFLSESEVRRHGPSKKWSEATLSRLANRYYVSREVVLLKLLTHERTTQAFYEAKKREWERQYRNRDEGGGFLRYRRRVLRDNGEAFTSLVIQAYEQRAISELDVSRYLGDVKLQHVDWIRGELAEPRG